MSKALLLHFQGPKEMNELYLELEHCRDPEVWNPGYRLVLASSFGLQH